MPKEKLKIIILLCYALTFSAIETSAQNLVGCGKQNGNMVYYRRNGFGSGLNTLIPRYDAPFSTYTTNTAICPRFSTVSIYTPTTICCIGATDCTNNLLYNFTNIPCPIDDYATVLSLILAALSVLVIRGKNLKPA